MHISENYDFYLGFDQDLFLLVYMGEFNDSLTTKITEINSAANLGETKSKKRLSYLITECFQNIVRHSAKKQQVEEVKEIPEMFVFRARLNLQQIVTTNAIKETYAEILKPKLESLHNLSAEALKELYMDVLRNGQRTERGGAGLGLIDMARKSGRAPTYCFDQLEGEFSNFFFQVNITAKDFNGVLSANDTSLDPTIKLYRQLSKERLLLLQKGDFSQDLVLGTINLFANNLDLRDEQIGRARKMIYILIEMLQNISRHAHPINGRKEGMFYLTETESSQYRLCACNYVNSSDGESMKSSIDKINQLDKIALTKLYKQQLMEDNTEGSVGAGIGLIEMRRNTTGQINYDIRKINEDYSFFALQVEI